MKTQVKPHLRRIKGKIVYVNPYLRVKKRKYSFIKSKNELKIKHKKNKK